VISTLNKEDRKMSEIKCSRCKHRLPKEICGCSKSPYYNQKIEPTDSCDYFLENPAQEHFVREEKKKQEENGLDKIMKELREIEEEEKKIEKVLEGLERVKKL